MKEFIENYINFPIYMLKTYFTMDNEKLSGLLRNICNWSYSHRVGNGCLTQEEQNELIKESFEKLLRVD